MIEIRERKKQLTVIHDLIERLRSDDIRYCFWKGNRDASAIFQGKKDLDVLVDRKHMTQFCVSVSSLGFKRAYSPCGKICPSIADYIGIDQETGALVHLHVHYQLILGAKHFPNYHFPIESILLENVRDIDGIKMSKLELELIVFIIQTLIRCRNKDISREALRHNSGVFPLPITKELNYFIEHYDDIKLQKYLSLPEFKILGSIVNNFLKGYRLQCLSPKDIRKTKHELQKALKPFRCCSSVKTIWKVIDKYFGQKQIIKALFPIRRKTLESGGLVIAFIGVDGSGKSTLVNEVNQWLSWKLDVKQVYMGIPKSIDVRILKFITNKMKSLHRKIINNRS